MATAIRLRLPVLLLLMAVAVLAPAVPAFASKSATSTKDVVEVVIEEEGTASGDGTAIVGDADATSDVIIVQRIVQVGGNKKNVTQIASNTATVFHGVAALSGDAHADDGALAISGDATASAVTVIYQLIIQVVAGRCKGDTIYQEAHQVASVDQVAIAISGDADAPADTFAITGDATATTSAYIEQVSEQIHICWAENMDKRGKGHDRHDHDVFEQHGMGHYRHGYY